MTEPGPDDIEPVAHETLDRFLTGTVSIVPFLALGIVGWQLWASWLHWSDLAVFAILYVLTGLGVTVGFHRLFTHRAFKTKRWLRGVFAALGSVAIEGPVISWVADHRKHHAFADQPGDPHSPHVDHGVGWRGALRGLAHAHMGWLFERVNTNAERFAPDLLADRDVRVVDRLFPLWMVLSLVVPSALGGLITWSWWGVLTAFFWAGLVRVSFLHHVTWSINSICHMIGERPFTSRDKAANFWPLAILSMGESWHNSHHADPTCARHGVLRGQIDISARLIWIFERLGWVSEVRWTNPERLARIAARG